VKPSNDRARFVWRAFDLVTALRSCRVPPRNSKVSFELRPRETLILKCLRQERPFLIRTECCSLPIQRSDGAVPAHVFQNSLPTHSLPPFPFWSGGLCTGRFSKSLVSLAERADGLRTVDLRPSSGLSGLPCRREGHGRLVISRLKLAREAWPWKDFDRNEAPDRMNYSY
jgi:hypothetical protein